MRKRWLWLTVGIASFGLMAAACSNGGGNAGGNTVDELTGELFISGSSTVEPISGLVAELFNEENPGVAINVEGPGTGDGFELFCNGETDISDASRAIDSEEAEVCDANDIEYIELEVAIDGIAVLTSVENDQVECLTFGDLYALLGPESEGFGQWSDANKLAQDVGGTANFPNVPLVITAPGEESGTFDSFVELVGFEDIGVERGLSEDEAATTRPDYQSSGNDNIIIEGIAGTPTSLGWVGFSFFTQNRDVVRAIDIDGGDGCVTPTEATIADGTYPLQRTLYIYVNKDNAAEKPELQAFVDFYLTDTGVIEAVSAVGYVPLPNDRIEGARSTWESEQL